MTVYTPVSDSVHLQAAAIRDMAENAYTRVRGDGRFSVDAIRAAVAAAYLKARDEMTALQQRVTNDAEARTRTATAAIWSIDDIAGNDPATRAAVSMSYRDAQERAAEIPFDRPQDAVELLKRAEDSGDEVLARAVAQRAWACGALGEWADVLNAYTSTRPKAAAALTQLSERTKMTAQDLFAFALAKPAELQAFDDWQLPGIAEQASA